MVCGKAFVVQDYRADMILHLAFPVVVELKFGGEKLLDSALEQAAKYSHYLGINAWMAIVTDGDRVWSRSMPKSPLPLIRFNGNVFYF